MKNTRKSTDTYNYLIDLNNWKLKDSDNWTITQDWIGLAIFLTGTTLVLAVFEACMENYMWESPREKKARKRERKARKIYYKNAEERFQQWYQNEYKRDV